MAISLFARPDATRASTSASRAVSPAGSDAGVALARVWAASRVAPSRSKIDWTPGGFIGQMFKIVGRNVPPPAGIRSPLEWGTEARLAELLAGVARLDVQVRHFVFRYRSAQDWLDTFRRYYGPTLEAFGTLDEAAAATFEQELLELARVHNTSTNGTLPIPSEYVEVVAVKAG